MAAPDVAFLTPYWSGAEMMRIHLASLRRFHPSAPILVSARGVAAAELQQYQREFNIRYWMEDCGYTDAYLRLLQRCPARMACVLDHDTVLLSPIDSLVARVAAGESDLVGIEERIRLPTRIANSAWPGAEGWLRFAPGSTASNFLIFDWRAFASRWGLRGIFGRPDPRARHFDFDYGIGQRLPQHHYLRPYHAARYGLANLLKDGQVPVVWHQWYGSYRTRLIAPSVDQELVAIAQQGEAAFLADYPNLVLDDLTAAWGPDCDTVPSPSRSISALARIRQEIGYSLRAMAARLVVGLERSSRGANPG
jgi:hypothetical protein